jgi:hypothetical protein
MIPPAGYRPAILRWQAEPYRLWSLLDMLRFFAHDFVRGCGVFAQVWHRLLAGVHPDDKSMQAYFAECKFLIGECERLGLPVSLKAGRTIEKYITSGATSLQEMGRQLVEFHTRIIDELEGQYFLMIPAAKAETLTEPLRGWDVQIKAFPSCQTDIEEAQKSFVLQRYTASVFHLMRALETPLRLLSAELGIVKHSPTWQAYLSVMEKAIAGKFPDKSKAHDEKRTYFSALEGHLRAIKTAWRNPTMHEIARVYTEEMAQELIVLVRGFMREAAIELQEPP